LGKKLENARKVVVPLVLMNRHINQSKAKNTYVLNSRYIKVQHHTL